MTKRLNDADNKQVGGSHYHIPISPLEIIEANNLYFFEGSVLKYLLRYRKKNGVQDLQKAIHYLEKMIEIHDVNHSSHVGNMATHETVI